MLFHTTEPDALRAVLRDVFGWSNVDAGGGWLIFALPPAEIAVHPAEGPSHQISLMCDNLESTMVELQGKGIEFTGEPTTQRFGVVVTMVLPGNVEVMLYEPLHPTAI
jgi:hypothetical protein